MPDPRLKVVYIAGDGRSGSTLLAELLGHVDGIVSLGEIKHLWDRNLPENHLCGCGRTFHQCPFWLDVIAEAFGRLSPSDVQHIRSLRWSVDRIRRIPQMMSPFRSRKYQEDLASYKSVMTRLYRAISKISGDKIVVDSSKEVSTLFLLDLLPDIELKVLHLVRDSRGVAYSWSKKVRRLEIPDQVVYMPTFSPAIAGIRWMLLNGLAHAFHAWRKAVHYDRLRYEELATSPESTLHNVLSRLGVAGADLSFVQEDAFSPAQVNHMLAGNPSRFRKGVTRITTDNEWKTEMKGSHRLFVSVITAPFLWQYDYFRREYTCNEQRY